LAIEVTKMAFNVSSGQAAQDLFIFGGPVLQTEKIGGVSKEGIA